MSNPEQSPAIVHDYLNQRGGAERVVLEMAQLWPRATIYTSLYRPESTFPGFRNHEIRTSPLDRIPVDKGFRNLFPLYPYAFRSFGTLPQQLVISSSSGWAHGVRTRRDSFHVVYCYTPARWLYGNEYLRGSLRQRILSPFAGAVRRWDQAAARPADLYIAISSTVRRRIHRVYGRDAPVVAPPVDVDRFQPRPRGDRLLVVSRLLPYKRVDLVVQASSRLGVGLDVVGTGPALDDLRRTAGPTVTFHGRLEDADVTGLMERCSAFCLPGREDFGITAVEANAAGKPVVAFASGGASETLENGVSGALFPEQTVEAVIDAIRRCDELSTPPERLASMARRYSRSAFRDNLLTAIDQHAARTGGAPAPAAAAAGRIGGDPAGAHA
jgi:glycosyltransferase involved in cell wall biosynthesis